MGCLQGEKLGVEVVPAAKQLLVRPRLDDVPLVQHVQIR